MLREVIQDRLQTETGPTYRLVAESIRSLVLDGTLQPGSRLPPVRELAAEIGVTQVLVQRAYAELRRSGLVTAVPGQRTTIAPVLRRSQGNAVLAGLTEVGSINTFEKVSRTIGTRSLATAVPDPGLFRADEFLAELNALRKESEWVWYYGSPAGEPALQAQIGNILRARGIDAEDQHVTITCGSTGALFHTLALLNRPLIVERPTLLLGRDIFSELALPLREVDTSELGLDLAALEDAVRTQPGSALVVHPTFHPATGCTMSLERRLQLIGIAEAHDAQIVEVDACRHLAFEPPPPPLAALSRKVIYIDSFSYCLAPGLRTGYAFAPAPLAARLGSRLKASGISSAIYAQNALARYLAAGRLQSHLRRVIPVYRARRNAMLGALDLNMPRSVTWSTPGGGYSCWVTLPREIDTGELYRRAVAKGCCFTPGEMFSPSGCRNSLRLAYGTQDEDGIREAVSQLAELVCSAL